jgi:hypothetical protein
MERNIKVSSGHTLYIIESVQHPAKAESDQYKKLYEARNGDAEGVILLYLATGYKPAPKEVHTWYRNGKMCSGFGTNMKDAIEDAIARGWLDASI